MSANVIDFEAARQRLASPAPSNQNPILAALDALGVALADHGHTWTERERSLYETAVTYLTCGGTDFRFVPGPLPTPDPRIEELLRPFMVTAESIATLDKLDRAELMRPGGIAASSPPDGMFQQDSDGAAWVQNSLLRHYEGEKQRLRHLVKTVEPFVRQWRIYKSTETLAPGNDPERPAISMLRDSWQRLEFVFENMPTLTEARAENSDGAQKT